VSRPHAIVHGAFAAVLLLGCQSLAPARSASNDSFERSSDPAAAPTTADNAAVRLDLILRMIEQGHLHAALAHLDSLPERDAALPAARLARAAALRRLARAPEAEQMFRELLDTPLAAEAYRGLGLLEAARGDVGAAVASLESARAARPTDTRIRNDLGYALLLAGRLGEAETELRTAVDLGDGKRAVRNLVMLLFLRAEDRAALELAARSGLSSRDLDRIRRRAASVRGGGAAESPKGDGTS
jgi:Flp pilus assembly protein TadD